MPQYDIFVSYSSVHRDLVNPLVQLLQVANRYVFLDFRDIEPGDKWEQDLLPALKRSKKVVVIWCIHASRSEWVLREVEIAVRGKKRIIPVLIDDTPLPENLAQFQWIDMSKSMNHIEINRAIGGKVDAESCFPDDRDEAHRFPNWSRGGLIPISEELANSVWEEVARVDQEEEKST